MVFGAFGIECLGEFIIMTGNDTTNTHTACWRYKIKFADNLLLYSIEKKPTIKLMLYRIEYDKHVSIRIQFFFII
jgi:hypothetical protein